MKPVSQGAVLESRFKRLRVYNAIMGTFHLAQAGAIFALSNDFALPVTTNFLHWMPGTETLETVTETLYDLRIGPLVGIFLLISAIAHYTVSSPGVFKWYVQNLKKGINYARWYEYSLSASLMVVIIAMLSGVYDVGALVLIFTCNAAMIFFGLMMELHNQTTAKTNWTAFTLGCVVGFVPWIVIAVYFFGSLSTATETIPTFVYYILASLFVLFFSFALNMFLQYKKVGPWKDYLFGESMYILLSLVAKSALAWQVFGGTLARQM